MPEKKSHEPNTVPDQNNAEKQPGNAVADPGQTNLMPIQDLHVKPEPAAIPTVAHDSDSMPAGRTDRAAAWLKKLSDPSVKWILLSMVLVFLTVLFLLIVQTRQKSKIAKPLADEPSSATIEAGSRPSEIAAKIKKNRQAENPILLLGDDEFMGQAPIAVAAGGPLLSADKDPELAAIAAALKLRLKTFADGKSTNRGGIVTQITKGDYRGFRIVIQEKIEKQNLLAEEISITTPQKGFIRTVNGILESIRDCDLERFAAELQDAGLEIVKPSPPPGSKIFQVQFKTKGAFGKPLAGEYLISGNSVGKISLGMSTARLETMLLSSYVVLKRKVLVNESYHDVYKVLDQSNEPLFFIYENKGLVWGISIISEFFKTEMGIGIGSSLGNLRIHYPKVNLGISEKKTPFVQMDGVDGIFILQSEGIDFARRIFSNQAKVISILIGNSPEFE